MEYFSGTSYGSTTHNSKKRSSSSCSSSYYDVLCVRPDSSATQIRSAYRKLAMKWHPDRWCGKKGSVPATEEVAKRRFQAIQEAYEVLSDQRKRNLYDFDLYDASDAAEEEEDVDGFAGFVEEMLGLMASVKREERTYTLNELRGTLQDMASGYDYDSYQPFPDAGLRSSWANANSPKRCRRDDAVAVA